MQSKLEIELRDLALKVEARAMELGFNVNCEIEAMEAGWIPFKLRVTGPSRRSASRPEFKDEIQSGVFTARQAKMLCRSHSLWGFWGKEAA